MMAIATLALCYNNGQVFQYTIKIRKGQAVQLILQSNTTNNLRKIMAYYCKEVSNNTDIIMLLMYIIQCRSSRR